MITMRQSSRMKNKMQEKRAHHAQMTAAAEFPVAFGRFFSPNLSLGESLLPKIILNERISAFHAWLELLLMGRVLINGGWEGCLKYVKIKVCASA
eukprot:m.148628 g.148628  ORF g.148628 m.148628 type:complete len:95 (+) comp16137_c2_seq1:334-618(+)